MAVRIVGMKAISSVLAHGLAVALMIVCAGCGMGVAPSAGTLGAAAGATGRAMGGEQPIVGASVKLWRVNTDGSAATNILTSTVTTDANGYFTLTGLYSCTTSPTTTNSELYVTVMGGNSGALGNNNGIALMAALGQCGTVASAKPFVVVNEVTTVATVFALQQFLGVTFGVAGAEDIAVNTLTQSVTGMQNAFATVPVLVTLSQGAAVSSYANATIENTKINTMANILTACVNSNGTGQCANLFAAATPSAITPTAPTAADTIQAALYMAQNPMYNMAQLFAFQTGVSAPFSPSLSAPPFDWTLGVIYSLGGSVSSPVSPTALTADANGAIWVVNGASNSHESLIELGANGQQATGSPFLPGSTVFDQPANVAVDTLGNVWVANSKANSSKNDLASITISGGSASYATHSAPASPTYCQPDALALDASNNAWFTCSGITNLYEFANTGTVSVPVYGTNPTAYQAVGSSPNAMAVDTAGNVWVANGGANSISEFPAGFTPATTPTSYAVGYSPNGIAVDHTGNVWAVGATNVTELAKSGSSYTLNSYSGANGGAQSAQALAIDGAGNIWNSNAGVFTYSGNSYLLLSEFNNSGTAITTVAYADIPGAYSILLPSSFGTPVIHGITIDPSGNLWIAGCGSSSSCNSGATGFVVEFVGMAEPPVTPLSTSLAGNDLGCCSFTPTAPGGTAPTSAGYVTLQASSYAPMQESDYLSFLVTRNGGSTGAISVNYATSDGTGVSGGQTTCTGSNDYGKSSGTLTWSSGDTSVRTISVPWCDASNYTGSKTFTVTLSGAAGGASITPYPTTSVSVTDQVTSAVISAGTYPWFTGTPPPYFLNPPGPYFTGIAQFREDLPVDIYGGTGGINGNQFNNDEVTTPTLMTFSNPNFYMNGSNQLVFNVLSNGTTATNGGVRSELREVYTGTNAVSGGFWYPYTNATNSLTGICTVNAVAGDANVLSVAQIHAVGNPFMLLQFEPTTAGSTSGLVQARIVPTFTSNNNTYITLLSNVNLGDTIQYSINWSVPTSTSAGTLTVWVNDLTTGVNGPYSSTSPLSYTSDPSWSSYGMVYHLGAYVSTPNTGNPPGQYSQVVYTSWTLCHAATCYASH